MDKSLSLPSCLFHSVHKSHKDSLCWGEDTELWDTSQTLHWLSDRESWLSRWSKSPVQNQKQQFPNISASHMMTVPSRGAITHSSCWDYMCLICTLTRKLIENYIRIFHSTPRIYDKFMTCENKKHVALGYFFHYFPQWKKKKITGEIFINLFLPECLAVALTAPCCHWICIKFTFLLPISYFMYTSTMK